MKNLLIILLFIATSFSVSAQSKVNTLLYKGAIVNQQLNNLGVKGDSSKSSLQKITGLFAKKGKAPKSETKEAETINDTAKVTVKTTEPANSSAVNSTVINITGIDFPTLQTLNENIKVCNGVQASTIKFNSDASVITVNHSGTTADLLKLIELTSKNIVSSKNIQSFEEGKISLKL